jgi:hypothetical protein
LGRQKEKEMIIHEWISSDGSELVPTTDVKLNLTIYIKLEKEDLRFSLSTYRRFGKKGMGGSMTALKKRLNTFVKSKKHAQSNLLKRDLFEGDFDLSGTLSLASLTLSPYKLRWLKEDFALSGTV